MRRDRAHGQELARLGDGEVGQRSVEQDQIGQVARRLDDRFEGRARDRDAMALSQQLLLTSGTRPGVRIGDEDVKTAHALERHARSAR